MKPKTPPQVSHENIGPPNGIKDWGYIEIQIRTEVRSPYALRALSLSLSSPRLLPKYHVHSFSISLASSSVSLPSKNMSAKFRKMQLAFIHSLI